MPPAPRQHARQQRAAEQHRSGEVHRDGVGDLNGRPLIVGGRAFDAGVVDQHIDIHRGLRQRRQTGAVAYVDGDDLHLACACGRKLIRHSAKRCFRPRGKDQVESSRRQMSRDLDA